VSKDPNYAAKLEKAIADRYGQETIQNPKASWTEQNEKDYIEELKKDYRHTQKDQPKEEVEGVLISKELLSKETERSCPVCSTYSFKSVDDLYMTKFECCFDCYIKFVEGRLERWNTGWRPKL
tara:strand:- start:1165 stop:1533 length:369 start_codon:yes stop_codon:yes gene_type:complete